MLIYIKKYQIVAYLALVRLWGITFAKISLPGVGKGEWRCALHSVRALRSIRFPFDVAIYIGVGFCEVDGFLRSNNRGAAPLLHKLAWSPLCLFEGQS